MALVQYRRIRKQYGLGLVPFTGTYDPAIDAGEGYSVDTSSYGAFDAAKSAYQIAQLQAAGAKNIQYDPYTRTYVDASTTQIYNDAGTGQNPATWTAADQSALETRIATVLNDPNSAPAAKQLVQLPGYGTPQFDQSVNSGTNPALTHQVTTLIAQAQAQAPAPPPPGGQSYLVGGVSYATLAEAQAAQARLNAAGVTLASQLPGAGGGGGAGTAGSAAGPGGAATDLTGNVWDAGAPRFPSDSGGNASGGEGGALPSLPLPLLAGAAALLLLVLASKRRR